MQLIKRLSVQEAETIKSEINSLLHLLDLHYQLPYDFLNRDGALRAGKSIWIHGTDNPTRYIKYDDKIPTIASNMQSIPGMFGRSYIYQLLPGEEIYPHQDLNPYFKSVNRYHIYLDIHEGVSIEYSPMKIESNTLIAFDATYMHSYKNFSDKPLQFVVFDIYKS